MSGTVHSAGAHPRPDPDDVVRLASFGAATVHEALGKRGALPPRIKPLDRDMRVCGPAHTVICPPGDNLIIHLAITVARPGDVLVVENGARPAFGPFGDIMAEACRVRGITGLVIDGSVRDGSALRAMRFPVFCTGLCIRGTEKAGGGSIGEVIRIGGVPISPGDVVLGDEDGIVVVPRDEARFAADAARQRETAEAEVRAALHRGPTTLDLLGLRDGRN